MQAQQNAAWHSSQHASLLFCKTSFSLKNSCKMDEPLLTCKPKQRATLAAGCHCTHCMFFHLPSHTLAKRSENCHLDFQNRRKRLKDGTLLDQHQMTKHHKSLKSLESQNLFDQNLGWWLIDHSHIFGKWVLICTQGSWQVSGWMILVAACCLQQQSLTPPQNQWNFANWCFLTTQFVA